LSSSFCYPQTKLKTYIQKLLEDDSSIFIILSADTRKVKKVSIIHLTDTQPDERAGAMILIDNMALILHIVSGYLALVIGIAAMTAPKKRGRHTFSGRIYFWLVNIVCTSAVTMAVIHWEVSSYLFYVAIFSFLFNLYGYLAFKKKWKNWMTAHIAGMGGSYIAIVTGFLVVNQKHTEWLNDMPSFFLWLLPTIIGTPFIIKTGNKYEVRKHKRKHG